MTQDKARKTATRRRMAETGEPYCEARRAGEYDREARRDPDSVDPDSAVYEDPGQRLERARARAAAEEARHRAELAELQASQAQEAADLAQEFADEAEELACAADSREADGEFEDGEFEDEEWAGGPGPLPPGPPRHPQDRVEQILWRFDQFRQRAEEIVGRAERILNLGREESEPRTAAPGSAAPGAGEPDGRAG